RMARNGLPPGPTASANSSTATIVWVGCPGMKLMIRDERGGTPRTRPVAARVNSPPSETAGTAGPVWLATRNLRCVLSTDDELMLQHRPGPERDHEPVDVAAVVLRARVDRESRPDSHLPSRLVDVPVQREQGLHFLDDLPHRGRADRHRVGLTA